MKIEIEIPDNLQPSSETLQIFKMFTQSMCNRLCVGEQRYGPAKKSKRYHSRLKIENEAYSLGGNAEHLINIANYCVLEWIAPEHPDHHFNPKIGSVTRAKRNLRSQEST